MKKPLIDKCPCCEVELFTRADVIEAGYETVTPLCASQLNDEYGRLVSTELQWTCAICSCEWKHGRFEEKEV